MAVAERRQRMRNVAQTIDDHLSNNIYRREQPQRLGLPGSSAENVYLDRLHERRRELRRREEEDRREEEERRVRLIIANAPHIGDLELDLSNGTNALSLDKFVDGEELVRLSHSNLPSNIYKIETLQEWFNTGKISNPLTRENITQDDIERFRYVEKLTKGGRRKGKKSRKGKKASRKYRKTNRRNGK